MRWQGIVIAVAFGMASSTACAEPMVFAIYELSGEEKELIAEGSLNYSVDDVEVEKRPPFEGHPATRKTLPLAQGFEIGTTVIRNPDLRGFGLWIANEKFPNGFSWEWFYVEEGDVFRKLQEEGRLRVTQVSVEDGLELQSVEFLTDVTMRFKKDVNLEPGLRTHEVVISKGSILRIAP